MQNMQGEPPGGSEVFDRAHLQKSEAEMKNSYGSMGTIIPVMFSKYI